MEVYILQVIDFEDSFEYITLVYDNADDFNKAFDLITDFDDHYYDDDNAEGNYYEDLLQLLEDNNLYSKPKEYTTITVR